MRPSREWRERERERERAANPPVVRSHGRRRLISQVEILRRPELADCYDDALSGIGALGVAPGLVVSG
jgi:hypothetical protein